MAYRLFDSDSLAKEIAELLFQDTTDFWMGYHDHEEILEIIEAVKSDFLSLAESILDGMKNYTIRHYFETWDGVPPEDDLWALSTIGRWNNGEKVTVEKFLALYSDAYDRISALWRVGVVGGTCIIDQVSRYLELKSELEGGSGSVEDFE